MVGKDGRHWFPLENGFTRDNRILDAGERAGWLFIAILGHISEHKRPGYITDTELAVLGVTGWRKRLDALIGTGLLEKHDDHTYRVPSWDAWRIPVDQDHAAYMREWRKRKRDSR